MSLYTRYRGTFATRTGSIIRADILQEADTPFASIGALIFPADEPIVIERSETAKDETICSSMVTLRLLSPSDRTYEDLYTIAPGTIRLDLYRDGKLIWSGTLDPEFYEEPYATRADYEVSLTFGDFGILDRLLYDLSGEIRADHLLDYILSRTGIAYDSLRLSISSTVPDSGDLSGLEQLTVRSDNFYDEDGEASSLRDVLNALLRPLALRIEQRAGVIYVYDLHAAYETFATQPIYWLSDDQVLGTDSVYNRVKISFSTYASSELLSGEVEYPGEYSDDMVSLDGSQSYDSYYPDYGDDLWVGENVDYNNISFTIFRTPSDDIPSIEKMGLAEVGYFFFAYQILPMLGGNESSGIGMMYYTGGHGDLKSGWPKHRGLDLTKKYDYLVMRTPKFYLPALAEADRLRHSLRLSMQLLLDARYNPFTTASEDNESGNYNTLNTYIGYLMVPCRVILHDAEGNALYYYDNSHVARSSDRKGWVYGLRSGGESEYGTTGVWRAGDDPGHSCWLSYYSTDDRKGKAGVQGWTANRHNIGLTTADLYPSLKEMDDGQIIPYPPTGGYISVTVYSGFRPFDFGEKDFDNPAQADKHEIYRLIRWLLFQAPRMEIVKNNTIFGEIDTEDIEYTGRLNDSAKDDYEIEVSLGTSEKALPAARGQLLATASMRPLTVITRAGRTSQAEKLLMGTLYSQYADRKTRLSGSATPPEGMSLMTDACQGDKKFIITSEVTNLMNDEAEITMVELRPDEYDEAIID